jgi:hypothetical protein
MKGDEDIFPYLRDIFVPSAVLRLTVAGKACAVKEREAASITVVNRMVEQSRVVKSER